MSKQFLEEAKKRTEREADKKLKKGVKEQEVLVGSSYLEESKDANARNYAEKHIMPKIDAFVEKHQKDGTPITKREVEKLYTGIMDQMVKDGIMTKEDKNAYLATTKETKKLKVFDRVVDKPKDVGSFKEGINRFRGIKPKMEQVDEYKKVTREVIIPSKFQQDIDALKIVGTPNTKGPKGALQDKLLYGIVKMCSKSSGEVAQSIAGVCSSLMNKGSKQERAEIENKFATLTQKMSEGLVNQGKTKNLNPVVVAEAKKVGDGIKEKPRPELGRLGNATKTLIDRRHQKPKNPGRSK